MCTTAYRVAVLVTTIFTLASPALAQTPQTVLTGLIHDYTPPLDPAGPWQVVGDWSLTLNRASGKVDFVASMSMVRSDNALRQPHTHHISLSDGQVTALATGYRINGIASITLNGALAPFSGSPVDIEITGSSAVPFANVGVTFGGAAAAHFGPQQFKGVVTYQP
jgi:hypothetical protein